MRGYIHVLILAVWLCLTALAPAESIYTWTDEDGTKRFSNEPPPEGVQNYQTEPVPPANHNRRPERNRRPGFDRMIENATVESERLREQRKKNEAAKAQELRRKADLEKQNKIDTQRRQLEKKIEAIKNRGFSPTYSKGMQDAQIKEIRQEIEKLNNSSDATARKK